MQAAPAKKRKLTWKETQELAALPETIDSSERERTSIYAQLLDPAVLRDAAAVSTLTARLAALDAELVTLGERWEVLEAIASES
jgi:ABC transport system ATP-binding/permease protein